MPGVTKKAISKCLVVSTDKVKELTNVLTAFLEHVKLQKIKINNIRQ